MWERRWRVQSGESKRGQNKHCAWSMDDVFRTTILSQCQMRHWNVCCETRENLTCEGVLFTHSVGCSRMLSAVNDLWSSTHLLAWACRSLPSSKSVARISEGVPQTCQISVHPCWLPDFLARCYSHFWFVEFYFVVEFINFCSSRSHFFWIEPFTCSCVVGLDDFRRAGIVVVHNRNRFLLPVPQLSSGCARLCCLELPRILLWGESCHNVEECRVEDRRVSDQTQNQTHNDMTWCARDTLSLEPMSRATLKCVLWNTRKWDVWGCSVHILRVLQTVLLLVTSMAHMNRWPLSTTVNSKNSSSSLVAPSMRSPVGSEVRAKIQPTSSVTRQHRRQDHSCRRAAHHLQSRSLGFAIPCCQRC